MGKKGLADIAAHGGVMLPMAPSHFGVVDPHSRLSKSSLIPNPHWEHGVSVAHQPKSASRVAFSSAGSWGMGVANFQIPWPPAGRCAGNSLSSWRSRAVAHREERSTSGLSKSFTIVLQILEKYSFESVVEYPELEGLTTSPTPEPAQELGCFFQGILRWLWCVLVLTKPGGKLCCARLDGARLEPEALEVVINEPGIWERFTDQELMLFHRSLRDGKFPRDTTRDAGLTESARRGSDPLSRNVTLGSVGYQEEWTSHGWIQDEEFSPFTATQVNVATQGTSRDTEG